MTLKKITSPVLFFCLLAMLAAGWLARPAPRAVQAQVPIYTPTPGPDGKIIWVVQSNDTLLSISLITGVSVDNLRQLNNLTGDTIIVGQRLIIGLAGPALVTPTLGPTPTPTPILPTPTPKPGSGAVCVLLFDDLNGDSLRQEEEPAIPQGAISINNRVGTVSLTGDSDPGSLDACVDTLSELEAEAGNLITLCTAHKCFRDLPEGDYTISVAVPEGYNPTTNNSFSIALKAGDQTFIDFGAQANSQTLAEAPVLPAEGTRSPLLGILGAAILLAGAVVAFLAARQMRGR
jgi:LysM repeat protein